jgi:hypothetical protein
MILNSKQSIGFGL